MKRNHKVYVSISIFILETYFARWLGKLKWMRTIYFYFDNKGVLSLNLNMKFVLCNVWDPLMALHRKKKKGKIRRKEMHILNEPHKTSGFMMEQLPVAFQNSKHQIPTLKFKQNLCEKLLVSVCAIRFVFLFVVQ